MKLTNEQIREALESIIDSQLQVDPRLGLHVAVLDKGGVGQNADGSVLMVEAVFLVNRSLVEAYAKSRIPLDTPPASA